MGGIALGQGVSNSGLLDIMGDAIQDSVDGFSLSTVVFILSPIVLVGLYFDENSVAVANNDSTDYIDFHQPYNC